ncbi:MAG: maleylacetoacetate isomerase [Pseudomonadota bacterium]
MPLRLHNFFRSSTSTRVRIALNLKGLDFEYVPYVLRNGETRTPDYLARNPAGLVPTLEHEDGSYITQSLSIIEWLEEKHPSPALLPIESDARSRVRSLAYMLACEVHPMNNLRVLFRITDQFGASEEAQKEWFTHWVETTFNPLEVTLRNSKETGEFCHGDAPSLADICLYAQVWNNRRFDIPVNRWPTITRIFQSLDTIPAFKSAAPPNQPDAA